VVLLHGLNGHGAGGSNVNTAHHLLNSGYSVVALDLEGHGRSSGTKGFLPQLEAAAVDVVALLKELNIEFPSLPVFLMGISMGGLTATLAALAVQDSGERLLSGVVLQCPLLRFAQPPPPLLASLIALLARIAPRLAIFPHRAGRGSKGAIAARVRAAMVADPLSYSGRLRVGTALALHRAAKHATSRLPELRIPFLVQHGDSDPLVALAGSQLLAATARAVDKQLAVYAGAGHNLQNEAPATLESVRRDYLEWIEARVDASWLSSGL
jgi:alpha-beta hydrolase superfamily lysophospholipase